MNVAAVVVLVLGLSRSTTATNFNSSYFVPLAGPLRGSYREFPNQVHSNATRRKLFTKNYFNRVGSCMEDRFNDALEELLEPVSLLDRSRIFLAKHIVVSLI